jgi:vancomycin permeability regulator SanA
MRGLGCLIFLVLPAVAASAFSICQLVVLRTGRDRIFSRVELLPVRETGLLLGTTRRRRDGGENPFFHYRIDAAAELYKRGRIKRLLVSGDNHRRGYNEPADMKAALLARGVPESAMTLDYAGLRTLDSVVRARDVFGISRLTIISQADHDRRALLIADHYGIDAIAYAARDVPFRRAILAHTHEWLARVKVMLVLPAIWVGALVFRHGVDVPYYDQWDGICPLFEKMNAGTLRLADFFTQHNEHRIFFPRLIIFPLAILTHWNVRAELLLIELLIGVMAWNIWRLMQQTGWGRSRAGFWLFFAANALLFSPLQYDNMLWGFQIGFLLPLVLLTASLQIASSARPAVGFPATLLLCTACTFSIASGFAAWILTFPLLYFTNRNASRRMRWPGWALWFAVFLISLLLYFHGYVKPPRHPSLWEAFRHPALALQFWLAYLGLPFAFGTALDMYRVSELSGAFLVVLLAGAGVYLWKWRSDSRLVGRSLPWLMLALAAVVNASLTTMGRVGLGLWQSLASRYVPFAVLLPIGLLFILAAIVQHAGGRSPAGRGHRPVEMFLAAAAAVLALLHLLGSVKSIEIWKLYQHARLTTKALVETIPFVDEPKLLEQYVHPIVPPLRARAILLDQLGFLRPGLLKSKFIADLSDPAPSLSGGYGRIQQIGKIAGNQMAVRGWALLPRKLRVADAVLLTYDDPAGKPVIFALADVGEERAEVASATGRSEYLRSGWVKAFDPSRFPDGLQTLKAWAFDAEACRAYRLE